MRRSELTDRDVEIEIEALRDSPLVKMGERLNKLNSLKTISPRRQILYNLRWLEKRGRELVDQGITMDDLNAAIAAEKRRIREEELF